MPVARQKKQRGWWMRKRKGSEANWSKVKEEGGVCNQSLMVSQGDGVVACSIGAMTQDDLGRPIHLPTLHLRFNLKLPPILR